MTAHSNNLKSSKSHPCLEKNTQIFLYNWSRMGPKDWHFIKILEVILMYTWG